MLDGVVPRVACFGKVLAPSILHSMIHTTLCALPPCSVLKGDAALSFGAAAAGEEDAPLNYGWAPFNGPNGPSLLGQVDLAFLAAYAAGMFSVGHLGDRTDLRIFLSIGMLGSGVCCALFGMVRRTPAHPPDALAARLPLLVI